MPALAGKRVDGAELARLASQLGSDVPFFLHGGTALGMGRGTELYPLPDLPALPGLLLASGIHVSTAEAYRALNRAVVGTAGDTAIPVTNALTTQGDSPILREFQTLAWALRASSISGLGFRNDFEDVVFERHPELGQLVKKLRQLGARPARMTGSGSAVFGLFATGEAARAASSRLRVPAGISFLFVPRKSYASRWRRALGPAFGHSAFAESAGSRAK